MSGWPRTAIAVSATALLAMGCQSPPAPASDGVAGGPADESPSAGVAKIDTLVRSMYSGIEDRERRVLDNPASFETWWPETMNATVAPPPDIPEVDFNRRMVVAASMGTQPTGGYLVEIAGVRREGEELTVVVRETSPGAGCIVSQSLTAPVMAVTAPRVSGEVRFVEKRATRDC